MGSAGDLQSAEAPGRLKAKLAGLAEGLKAEFGEDLKSVILYGSFARGEHVAGVSDVNLLVVLDRVTPPVLDRASKVLRRLGKRLALRTLFMSPGELASSRDTFAIELTDMQENHVVLQGEDVLASLQISPEHLRLQVEHELRAKLARLRQSYLRDAPSASALRRLMMNSVTSFLALFRAMVRVRGKTPQPTWAALTQQVAQEFDLDAGLLETLLAARKQERALPRTQAAATFDRYYMMIESAVRAMDRAAG